jgi:[ribosomal protein S18]-alanine N-acetyltransferase
VAPATTIEALDGSDLVALAQCMALDASMFPHPSVPLVAGSVVPRVWIARAEPGGGVIGFVATLRRANRLEILGLATDPAYRRAGIARALLRAAVSAARRRRRIRDVTLHVSTANAAAIALYESEGFAAIRTLARFYSPAHFANGGDAYEMVLRVREVSARLPPS